MSASSRFEILLPLAFNDGRPVPREFFAEQLDIWITVHPIDVL